MANDSVVETTQNWPAYQGTVTGCDTPGLWALFLGTFVTCHTTNGGPPAAMENTFDVCQKDSLSLVYHYKSCARYIVPLSRRLYIFAGYVTTLHLFACPSSIARRSCVWRRLRRRKWPAAWLKTEPSCADCNSMNGSYIMNHKEDSNTTILEKKKHWSRCSLQNNPPLECHGLQSWAWDITRRDGCPLSTQSRKSRCHAAAGVHKAIQSITAMSTSKSHSLRQLFHHNGSTVPTNDIH